MRLKDKKIRIFEQIHEVNENGFPVDGWKPIHSGRIWAYYRQLSGSEFYASAMTNATEEVVFTVNYRAGLDTYMLIEYAGRYFEITRIDNYEGYKSELDIYAKLSPEQTPEIVEE